MKKGYVKWFNEPNGYGFITIDGEDKDVFVHFSEILKDGFKTLNEDDYVEFEIFQDRAINVRVISE